jgi:hypothetical protein
VSLLSARRASSSLSISRKNALVDGRSFELTLRPKPILSIEAVGVAAIY